MAEDIYSKVHNLVIAGTGPAGLTAAIYASRSNLEPVIFEGEQAGGQLTITTDVENFPGFAKGIMGPELIEEMREQAKRFGTIALNNSITAVDFKERPFVLEIDNGKQIKAHAFIIATGASAKLLGLESESALMGYGVSACATCDVFFRGKKVMIVGGGDTAMEEANFLTKFAEKVTVVHRRSDLRASKIMQERAFENPKIDFIWNSVVEDILGVEEKKVRGVILRDVMTDETREAPCDGIFMAIGHKPNTDFLDGQVEMFNDGFIRVHGHTTETNVDGVFACGDVIDPHYRQAITAAGSGCKAAIDAERYLAAKKLVQ